MAKNISQVQKSFIIASIMYIVLFVIVVWIGILVISTTPGLNPKDITKHILFNYSYAGLKGLTLAGIMAMAMSTTDSFINSSAVLFVNDFCKPLKIQLVKNELLAFRIAAFLIGLLALILALKEERLMQIIITAYGFYMPVVTVPFTFSILGFRSSEKSVLIGMGAGLTTVVLWKILNITLINAIVPGVLMNSLFLFASHYLLKQPGGWIKIKHNITSVNKQKKATKHSIIMHITNFKFIDFIKKSTPSETSPYIAVGVFCMIMVYSNMHTRHLSY